MLAASSSSLHLLRSPHLARTARSILSGHIYTAPIRFLSAASTDTRQTNDLQQDPVVQRRSGTESILDASGSAGNQNDTSPDVSEARRNRSNFSIARGEYYLFISRPK